MRAKPVAQPPLALLYCDMGFATGVMTTSEPTDTLTGHLIGYARVSTGHQDAQLQRDALSAADCTRIFEDQASGKSTDGRPELAAALDYLRPGDVLVVWNSTGSPGPSST